MFSGRTSHPTPPPTPPCGPKILSKQSKKAPHRKATNVGKTKKATSAPWDLVPLPQRYRTNSPYPEATVLSDLIDKFDVIHHRTLAMFSSHTSHVRSIGRCLSWQGLQGIAAIKPKRHSTSKPPNLHTSFLCDRTWYSLFLCLLVQ